jgi:hypothetical protein
MTRLTHIFQTGPIMRLLRLMLVVLSLACPAIGFAEPQIQPDIVSLLSKVEQQASNEHGVSPADDGSIKEAWAQVLQVYASAPGSPGTRGALEDFIGHMKAGAAVARVKGSLRIAIDLMVLADQADRLLNQQPAHRVGDASSASETPLPEVTSAPADVPVVPLSNAIHAPPSSTDKRVPDAVTSDAAETFATRGDAALAAKDIWSARKFYDYAAKAGSVRAVNALAHTYDPAFLATLGLSASRVKALLATAPGEPAAAPSPLPRPRRREWYWEEVTEPAGKDVSSPTPVDQAPAK